MPLAPLYKNPGCDLFLPFECLLNTAYNLLPLPTSKKDNDSQQDFKVLKEQLEQKSTITSCEEGVKQLN